jgi:glycosyltransferase involved in cell wall biosynthesis
MSESTQPVISVLTPSLDQARYLVDALASVRLQGVPSVEHVVADGGSTDGTLELLQGRPEVRWRSGPDAGQSQALNRAAAMARGDIIGWLNSDDYYLPGSFSTVLEYFRKHPEVDVVHGDSLWVDEGGGLLRARADHPLSWTTLLYDSCYVQSTTCFFRRRLLDAGLLRWDESLRYQMDRELFLRLARARVRFSYLPVMLAAFRWHGGNASLQFSASLLERRELMRRYSPAVARSAVLDRASKQASRAWHVALKARAGGFVEERRWAALAGQSTLWMAAAAGPEEAR